MLSLCQFDDEVVILALLGGGGVSPTPQPPLNYIAAATYATVDDMKRRYNDVVLAQVTDPQALAIDEDVITKALEDASSEIDSYLAGRYRLPLNPVPRGLRLLACNIAMYQMLVLRPLGDIEDARTRYEDAIKYLSRVAKGEIHLGLTKTDDALQSTGNPQFQESVRTFGRDNMKGF